MELFRKMRGLPEFPSEQKGAGDVISHLSECTVFANANLMLIYFASVYTHVYHPLMAVRLSTSIRFAIFCHRS